MGPYGALWGRGVFYGARGDLWGAPQLRQVLDAGTYQLFTQKLTERELLRDPKFVWCIQVGPCGAGGGLIGSLWG